MCSLTKFELYLLRHEEERRRREEDMMRHREQLDVRRQPDGFKPTFMESVSTGNRLHILSDLLKISFSRVPDCDCGFMK